MTTVPVHAGNRSHTHETRLVTLGIDKPERDAFRHAFGRNLRSLRTTACLSQDQLAARCFLPAGHISSLERGVTVPHLEVLLLLRDALGMSMGELADGLVTPTRAAGRAQLLALLTQKPGSSTQALAKASGLPYAYVYRLVRYLESFSQLRAGDTGWQPIARGEQSGQV
jgi:transcriptional regulator with XRE-family HTH domain